jgi:hypothetical protein
MMATDKPQLPERYRSAIHTSDLGSEAKTFRSDSDVVGAYGLADKHLSAGYVTTGPGQGYHIPTSPLSVPLERLFGGDNRASGEIVQILAGMVWKQARRFDCKLDALGALDMAKECLAWHRHGTCKPCGGRAYQLIPGTVSLSSIPCEPCGGTGRIPFEDAIDPSKRDQPRRELARWAVSEMERAMGRAGPAAMAAIAARMEP